MPSNASRSYGRVHLPLEYPMAPPPRMPGVHVREIFGTTRWMLADTRAEFRLRQQAAVTRMIARRAQHKELT